MNLEFPTPRAYKTIKVCLSVVVDVDTRPNIYVPFVDSRSNSISLSGSMSTAAEKEGHTSAEGSEMGSVSNAKNTRERRKRKTPPSDDHQVSENNDELPSRTSRTRLSRRFNQSSSRGYKL